MECMPPSQPGDDKRRVFVSYSHDDEAHRHRISDLAAELEAEGFHVVVDQKEHEPAEGWQAWCRCQLELAEIVLCVCTSGYRDRFERRASGGVGRGVEWEGRLVEEGIYDRDLAIAGKCVVVLLEGHA